MNTGAFDNTTLEMLMAEVSAAEKAGVFARTQVNVESLGDVQPVRSWVRWYERAVVGLPIAACLAIFVGMASMFGGVSGSGANASNGAGMVSSAPVQVPNSFSIDLISECMAGPGHQVGEECASADFDGDGDVDMLDVSSFQLAAGR